MEKTDAVMNLTNAFIYSCEDISGVFLAFSEKLIKGTVLRKSRQKVLMHLKVLIFHILQQSETISLNITLIHLKI